MINKQYEYYWLNHSYDHYGYSYVASTLSVTPAIEGQSMTGNMEIAVLTKQAYEDSGFAVGSKRSFCCTNFAILVIYVLFLLRFSKDIAPS